MNFRFVSSIRFLAAGILLSTCAAQQPASASAPAASAPQLAAQAKAAPAGEISGTVKSGTTPLPGVSISAANTLTGQKVLTSSDQDGRFVISVPSRGRYVVRAEMAAFAVATKETVINADTTAANVDLEMQLASRAAAAQQQQQSAQGTALQQLAGVAGGGRGFQNLAVNQGEGAEQSAGGSPADAGNLGGNNGDSGAASLGGMDNAATESVSVSGRMGQTENFGANLDDIRNRLEDALRNGGQLNINGNVIDLRAAMGAAGIGGGGGGMGGFGGGSPMMIMIGPGGGGAGFGGGFGRFNVNKPHGALSYTVGDPIFDATPYSLNGVQQSKPDYMTNRFTAALGGPLNIPHVYQGGTKTFFFLNYSGGRNRNLYDQFTTVPTLLERSGDFSQTLVNGAPVTILNPSTHVAFANNQILPGMINPAAAGLLNYIPLPNQPGTFQNFRYTTTADQNTDNFNFRIMHNFGATNPRNQRGQNGQRGQGGGRGAGGRGGQRRAMGPRNNLNVGFNYSRGNSDALNPFPSIKGQSRNYGINVPIGYVRSWGRLVSNARVQFNRSRSDTSNQYANVKNIAGDLKINGVSTNPYDYGVPAISLSHYSGLRDINPSLRRDQTWTLGEGLSYSKGKFNWRFGGDFRRIEINPRTDTNARGTFVFTGFASGYDFADFLLGLPQQTSAQYGTNGYYFRGNSWDAYVQNDWRVKGSLTLNLGLRYEYVSPMNEKFNRIVNLDVDPLFTQTPVPVQPDQSGPFNGKYPQGLVRSDRNNWAPRVGIAWKPFSKTVVRAGYGVDYNTGAYANIVQQMAFQPPFTFTQTNLATPATQLTLQNGFPTAAPGTVTNNFGVNPNYRLGYVQTWNFGIQQEVTKTILLNADYNGAKGTRLDIERAPNRSANGVRIANAQPFLWWDSLGDSTTNSLSVRVRKRMQHGASLGGNYVWSKSLDNASTIGGGGTVVAQNDLNLHAERGLSSFNVAHRLSIDYGYELPFGTNKHWLSNGGAAAKVLGDWSLNGRMNAQTGTPLTARVVGNIADVARGVNGTLRADFTGQPIQLGNPSIAEFFNTAAFTAPALGALGNSRRNMIIGPGMLNFDMSLSKTIPLREAQGFDIRLDASNIFNHPHWGSVDTNLNSRTFGRVTSVGPVRKMTLTARYRF